MEKKAMKIRLYTVVLFFAIILIIVMACYIYIQKTSYNKEIVYLESNIIEKQKIINELSTKNIINKTENIIKQDGENSIDDGIQTENTIKVLVEMHEAHQGMPGPDGSSRWGKSKFIASDGWVYIYEYDEYNAKTLYPQKENLDELSKELMSKSKKIGPKLSDEELNLVKEYISNVEKGKEQIEEIKDPSKIEYSVCDHVITESFQMYNYALNKKILIDDNKSLYYKSSSLKKLYDIAKKYIKL